MIEQNKALLVLENPSPIQHLIPKRGSQQLLPHAPIYILEDNALELYAAAGNGSSANPYILGGWEISGSTGEGIFISGTTKYFRIQNCAVFNNSGRGILVENVAAGTAIIENNVCYGNRRMGIVVTGSSVITIRNNICYKNSGGIGLSWVSWCTVRNNTCDQGGYGISLYSVRDSRIANNTCSLNNWRGIVLSETTFPNLINNTCNFNDYGIYLQESENNLIRGCIVAQNERYGVDITYRSNYNVVYHNMFLHNGEGRPQASDSCEDNYWYNQTLKEGNYWSDHGNYTTNFYPIDGGAHDLYPLSNGSAPPPPSVFPVILGNFVILIIGVSVLVGLSVSVAMALPKLISQYLKRKDQ